MVTETIAHYHVLRKLGAGGMGEVYEAEDLRLGRHAALKFLPDALAHDARALERFQREARAASSLDHPNICTIYEIGEHEGRMFLAMQLLEGKDLRQRLAGHPLPLDEVIEIGMQIADALDAAHAQAIIHRDIKPSNIFVTNRGQAKLLDFGLAKFNLRQEGTVTDPATGTTVTQDLLSTPDSVMGTLSYMSPEQALGMDLDSRSDLFSLGAVLYEMATGVAPFSGNTSAAIFDSILNKHPIPAIRLNPGIPVELDHIISKAIEKDRDVRSQTASEIRADLKRLKRDTSSGKIERETPKIIRRRTKRWIGGGVAALAVLLASAWCFFPLPPLRVTSSLQLTNDGLAKMSLATDGARIYFSEVSGGQLVVAQVGVTGGESLVIPTPFRNGKLEDISPDHSQLLIGVPEGTHGISPAWSLPVPTGSPRRLADTVMSDGAWSPDMRLLAYTKESEVYLADADGSNPHVLVSVNGNPHSVRFSPDQTKLRFTIRDPNRLASSLWEVHIDGTHLRPLFPDWHNPQKECCGFWTPDGRFYLFLVRTEHSSDIFAITEHTRSLRRKWSAPVQLTAGPMQYDWITPSADSNKIFAVAIQPRAYLVQYDPRTKLFIPYLSGLSATDLAFSPDGKWIAYVSIPERTLWRSRIDGTERLQLTSPPRVAILPVWAPDGSRLVFNSFTEGEGWKALSVSTQGGAVQELLPAGRGGVDFNWSGDGKQIIFSSGPQYSPMNIQSLDLSTHQIAAFPGSEGLFSPRVSPDGNYLAALSRDSSTLLLYDFRAGKWSQWLIERGNVAFPTWSRDSKYLYFDNFMTDHPTCRRVKVGVTESEELFSLSALNRLALTTSGTWGGLTPDNVRLYVEDRSVQEIYSLQLRVP